MLTEELVDGMHHVNVFRCPFFQGEATFNKLVVRMCEEWWKPLVDTLLSTVHDELAHKLFPTMDSDAPLPTGLSSALRQSWQATLAGVERALHEKAAGVLRKESVFKTMNHYLTSKYEEELVLPAEVKETFLESITQSVYSYFKQDVTGVCLNVKVSTKDHEEVTEALGQLLEEAVEEHALRFNKLPLHQ
jgi:hypothetical protein